MKQSRRGSSFFGNIILFVGLVLIWVVFAPVKIGGQTSYVMVNGLSMEPNYHTGDLVIVRKSEAYQVGDVVTYRDAEMGAYVIHRIIDIKQGHFVIKGDNNSWIDAYEPTQDEIVGKQWIYAPKAGRAIQWFRKPINLSLTIFLLGGAFMTSMITKPPKGKKGTNSPSVNLGGILEGTIYLLGFLFLGFLGLTIFAFTRASTRAAETIPFQQAGSYSYSATGTPGVYDTEMVRSGEPVFPRLTCFLNIGFTYNIPGSQLQNISGSHQMFARIMDEPSGWQRTIPLIPQTAFTSNSYVAMGTLDLCQLEALITLVENETGLRTNTYTVDIVTNIAFTANASGQAITGAFDPTLSFKYDKVHFYLANTNNEIDPMLISKEDIAGNSNLQANTISLFGWKPTVGFVRAFAVLGLVISLSGLVVLGLFLFNTANRSEDALIKLRYGSVLVDVYERGLEPTSTTIDVTSMDDLVKLAERQGTMVLHMTSNFLHYYLVQNNGTTYRYVISTGKKGIAKNDSNTDNFLEPMTEFKEQQFPVAKPVHPKTQTPNRKNNGRAMPIQSPVMEPVVEHRTNRFIEQRQPVIKKTLEYVINTGEIGFTMNQPEKEIMKKVRL